MAPRRVPLVLPLATSFILVATAWVVTVRHLALTADGSYFLVRVITDETVFGPPGRLFADAARQLPVLALVWSGTTNTTTLAVALGVGQLVLPALVWSAAMVVARQDRVVFVAVAGTAILCAGSTWLFSVSENVLAVPVTVLLAVLLWLPRWGLSHLALACGCAFLLVSSYETTALTGIAFAAWAAMRGRATARSAERYACLFVLAANVASVVVALIGASGAGPGPSHASSFAYYLVSLEPWPVYLGFAGLAAIVTGLHLGGHPRAGRALAVVGGLALVLGVAYTELTISAGYEARGGTSAASFALLLYLWWRWQGTREGRERRLRAGAAWVALVPVPLALLVAVLVLDASRTWERDLDAFGEAVASNTGYVIADEVVPADRAGALWDWTAVYLSLVVRRDPDDAVLVDRRPSYVPFTPGGARASFPDEYTWGRRQR